MRAGRECSCARAVLPQWKFRKKEIICWEWSSTDSFSGFQCKPTLVCPYFRHVITEFLLVQFLNEFKRSIQVLKVFSPRGRRNSDFPFARYFLKMGKPPKCTTRKNAGEVLRWLHQSLQMAVCEYSWRLLPLVYCQAIFNNVVHGNIDEWCSGLAGRISQCIKLQEQFWLNGEAYLLFFWFSSLNAVMRTIVKTNCIVRFKIHLVVFLYFDTYFLTKYADNRFCQSQESRWLISLTFIDRFNWPIASVFRVYKQWTR